MKYLLFVLFTIFLIGCDNPVKESSNNEVKSNKTHRIVNETLNKSVGPQLWNITVIDANSLAFGGDSTQTRLIENEWTVVLFRGGQEYLYYPLSWNPNGLTIK